MRASLLGILLLGLVGTGVELLLLGHTEDVWQWVPLVLIALCLLVLAWHIVAPGARSVRALQGTMLLFLASGVAGVLLHYRGNVEFEREMQPSLAGLKLFFGAMAGATPALAPGTMVQLALVGLASTYRHPALTSPRGAPRETELPGQ